MSNLSAADLTYVRDLVGRRAAIVLDESKGYLVESRLRPLVRAEGVSDIAELLAQVRAGSDRGRLADAVVEAMTVNETSWFRDAKPFEMLAEDLMPSLLEARRTTRRLRIWSAACSTGQEPYSVAMLLRERFPTLSSWDVRIVATDISSEVLERTRSGRYSQLEMNRGLPTASLVKWFDRDGLEWVVKPELRSMIEVRKLNLAEPWSGLPSFDIVLLRNVLIYFGPDTKRSILVRARDHLASDGALLLGAAETLIGMDVGLERIATTRTAYYQPAGRTAGAAGSPAAAASTAPSAAAHAASL